MLNLKIALTLEPILKTNQNQQIQVIEHFLISKYSFGSGKQSLAPEQIPTCSWFWFLIHKPGLSLRLNQMVCTAGKQTERDRHGNKQKNH